jgi:hypothetical protein
MCIYRYTILNIIFKYIFTNKYKIFTNYYPAFLCEAKFLLLPVKSKRGDLPSMYYYTHKSAHQTHK